MAQGCHSAAFMGTHPREVNLKFGPNGLIQLARGKRDRRPGALALDPSSDLYCHLVAPLRSGTSRCRLAVGSLTSSAMAFHKSPRGRSGGGSGRHGHRRDGMPRHRSPQENSDTVILYGWHPVTLALANPKRRIRKLYATENAARRLAEENIASKISPEIVRSDVIAAQLSADAVHQGLLAEAAPLPSPTIDTLEPHGMIVVLDQITDPHNVGAILRSAAAFGVQAIVTTQRHSPEATGVLAKSASGALEYVSMVAVQNLARALAELKERGFMTVGLDSAGSDTLDGLALREPLALVMGAEGKGLRQLTRETCDVVARLDMPGAIKSLNVSNAAALALYIGASRLNLMS